MIVGNTHTTRVSALCFYSVKLIKSLTCIAWQNKQLSCVTISNTLTTARLGFTIVSPILAIWYIDILSVLKKFNRDLILSKCLILCLARYCKSQEKMPNSPYNILCDSAGHFSPSSRLLVANNTLAARTLPIQRMVNLPIHFLMGV